jgi:hypothetical protein
MSSAAVSHFLAFDEDERARRRDLACIAAGVTAGGGAGLLASAALGPSGLLFAIGALAGGILGRLFASRISAEEWDPPPTHHAFVGANSPDDIASD